MRAILLSGAIAFGTLTAVAQQPPPLAATDLTSAEITAFIDNLPKDVVSDRPIKVVDVGGYRVGVYGVFRPRSAPQDAVLHEVRTSEVYQMLEGAGTLVTGGRLVDERRDPKSTTVRGSRIEGGVSRRVVKGDLIIIPGRTPHWWSELETDIKYTIIRPDPENRLPLRPGESR